MAKMSLLSVDTDQKMHLFIQFVGYYVRVIRSKVSAGKFKTTIPIS